MSKLNFEKGNIISYTSVANIFLDKIMPDANGEFVKIYLYLLRCASNPNTDISISNIADIFNYTEKDIHRALRYWEQIGLLSLTYDPTKKITGIRLEEYKEQCNNANEIEDSIELSQVKQVESSTKKVKNFYSPRELERFIAKEEVSQLLYIVQKYLGKTLSSTETNTLLYFYDELKFPVELIEYLIEYCVSKDHRSMRYIEKVALDWAENNINTVEKAKEANTIYSNSVYSILKAFGISGRNPAESERAYIVKWTNSYGFNTDIIIDACNRTMGKIHQPSFEYADSILKNWKDKGVKHLSEVKVLDQQHSKSKNSKVENKNTINIHNSKNNFNSFSQRTYNYTELEKRLLSNN